MLDEIQAMIWEALIKEDGEPSRACLRTTTATNY